MGVRDWRNVVVEDGVLSEPNPEGNRVALWLPGSRNGGFQEWERVHSLPHSEFTVEPGVSAAAATSIQVRQPIRGFLGKLLGSWRNSDHAWVLPNGQPADQFGERKNDLLIVWADDEARSLDESWMKSRWPQSKNLRIIGKNLYLVSGVGPPAATPDPAPGQDCPRNQAEQLVASARAAGDRAKEGSALADLGAAYLHEGKVEKAIESLKEALSIAHGLGDRARQGDILGNLGLATLWFGDPGQALGIFSRELEYARDGADRFAEKTALERIGLAYSKLNDPIRALEAFEQALGLAKAVGHRKHEADLLWSSAIQYAELARRDEAIARGQAAIDLMEKMRNPQAAWFAQHLQKFSRGETGEGLADPTGAAGSPQAFLGGSIVAGMWAPAAGSQIGQPTQGPGLLRMAVSAAKSMAKFVGSGFKVVGSQALQQRLRTCAACEHHTGVRCRLCGCFTSAKARLAHEECPIGKWPA
jgi:tetratricopeptide (TPR) repeat protein